jgi:hypothetical protein
MLIAPDTLMIVTRAAEIQGRSLGDYEARYIEV